MSAEEILDLVNENDDVIGTIKRSESDRLTSEKLGYIRAVDMFIQNDKGELWVPKRTAHKKIAPNGLDYSVGGHVESGEGYDETLYRETEEEINLKIDPGKLTMVKKFGPASTPYFRQVYVYKSNETPDYNPDDFVSSSWLTPQALVDTINAGTLAKSSMLETITEIFKL